MVLILTSFVLMFFICEFGERLSHYFNTFDDAFGQCRWYLFPIEMQRMLVIATINTQQPVIIQSFGNIPCTRDSFKRVWNLLRIQLKSNFEFHLKAILHFLLQSDNQRKLFLFHDDSSNDLMKIFQNQKQIKLIKLYF